MLKIQVAERRDSNISVQMTCWLDFFFLLLRLFVKKKKMRENNKHKKQKPVLENKNRNALEHKEERELLVKILCNWIYVKILSFLKEKSNDKFRIILIYKIKITTWIKKKTFFFFLFIALFFTVYSLLLSLFFSNLLLSLTHAAL